MRIVVVDILSPGMYSAYCAYFNYSPNGYSKPLVLSLVWLYQGFSSLSYSPLQLVVFLKKRVLYSSNP